MILTEKEYDTQNNDSKIPPRQTNQPFPFQITDPHSSSNLSMD
jgi:hypothetical protein